MGLTSVSKRREHPYLDYLGLEIPVSLSTDDEGIFDIDIDHDCEGAIGETDVTYAELKQTAMNSIETSFASNADNLLLLTKMHKDFGNFETGFKLSSNSSQGFHSRGNLLKF